VSAGTVTASTATPSASLGAPRIQGHLLRGGLGLGAATLVASIANYTSNLALGRRLDADQFADAALVVSGLLLLSAVAVGLQLTVARAIAAGGGAAAARRIEQRALVVGASIGLAMSALSPLIASRFNMDSPVPLIVLAAGVPVFFSMAIRRGVLQASHRFGRIAISQIAEPMARLAVTVAALSLGLGATSAALGLVAAFAVGWVAASPGPGRLDIGSSGRVQRSALGATVLLLVGQVVIANGDLWVVAALIPSDAGSYAAVALVGRLVYIAGWSIVTVVFPSLVSGSGTANGNLLIRAVAAAATVGTALTVGAFVAGDRLIGLMVGDGYVGAGELLGPYALATTLFVVANLLAVADVAEGRRLLPAMLAAGSVLQTALLVLVSSRGIVWAVYAQLIAMAALVVILAAVTIARQQGRTGQPPPTVATTYSTNPAASSSCDLVVSPGDARTSMATPRRSANRGRRPAAQTPAADFDATSPVSHV
jgi:O-antigen/teichoic acid export membrane protein